MRVVNWSLGGCLDWMGTEAARKHDGKEGIDESVKGNPVHSQNLHLNINAEQHLDTLVHVSGETAPSPPRPIFHLACWYLVLSVSVLHPETTKSATITRL
jgi:hypothetical protein